LIRRLGAGALGVVYEAQHQRLARRVAIKLLSSKAASDPDLVSRFQREARVAGQIQHPHVVGVHDCGHDRGVYFLVMEYVKGTTLAGLIQSRGPLPWQEACTYLRQIASSLAHLAAIDIVHRDIKPANILVSDEGVAKLADLGLAKNLAADANEVSLTMQGVAMGSPAYMAPEQVRDAKSAGPAADLYSLGATFYHLLAGVPPFEGVNGAQVMMKVLKEEPRPIADVVPGLPAGIAGLVHELLVKNIDERLQTADEAIQAIDAALAAPQQARPRRRRKTTAPVKRSKTGVLLGAATVVLVVVVIAVMWFLRR
jgi:serine/threonine protein kinase